MEAYGLSQSFLAFQNLLILLQENLDEESAADEKLTEIAESEVNAEAEAQ